MLCFRVDQEETLSHRHDGKGNPPMYACNNPNPKSGPSLPIFDMGEEELSWEDDDDEWIDEEEQSDSDNSDTTTSKGQDSKPKKGGNNNQPTPTTTEEVPPLPVPRSHVPLPPMYVAESHRPKGEVRQYIQNRHFKAGLSLNVSWLNSNPYGANNTPRSPLPRKRVNTKDPGQTKR